MLLKMNRSADFNGAVRTLVKFRAPRGREKVPDTAAEKLLRARTVYSCALLVAKSVPPVLIQDEYAVGDAAQHRHELFAGALSSLRGSRGCGAAVSPSVQPAKWHA